MKRLVLMTIAVLLVAAPLMAGNYLEDFESYNAGPFSVNASYESLNWAGSGGLSIQANSAMNGTKVLATSALYEGFTPRFSGVTFQDGTVASFDLRMSTDSELLWFNVSNTNDPRANAGYPTSPYAGIVWDPTNMSGAGAGLSYSHGGFGWTNVAGSLSKNVNYRVNMALNFTSQTIAYSIVDLGTSAVISFDADFGLATTTASAGAGNFYFGTTPGTVLDNLAVTTVPEPGSMLALGSGLIGFVGLAIRRRK